MDRLTDRPPRASSGFIRPFGRSGHSSGSSGGIVVDTGTQQIVGILGEIANDGQPVALAVSIEALVEFVSRVQPSLSRQLFAPPDEVDPLSADFSTEI